MIRRSSTLSHECRAELKETSLFRLSIKLRFKLCQSDRCTNKVNLNPPSRLKLPTLTEKAADLRAAQVFTDRSIKVLKMTQQNNTHTRFLLKNFNMNKNKLTDAPDLHAGSSQSSESRLGSRTRSLCPERKTEQVTTWTGNTHTHLGLKGLADPGPAAMQSEAAGLSPVKPVRLTKVTINTRLLSIVRALNRPC